MGIYGFNTYVKKSFSDFIIVAPKKIDCDYLFIDSNSMIHTACQKVFSYQDFEGVSSGYESLSIVDKYRKAYEMAFVEIVELVQFVKPREGLYIFFDGVCPASKLYQQRKRRYGKEVEDVNVLKKKNVFSSSVITPATTFMYNLGRYFSSMIRVKLNLDTEWRHLKVYLSTPNSPGEGEQKILQFIRRMTPQQREKKFCISSIDSDVIVLGLCTLLSSIVVLQPRKIQGRMIVEDTLYDIQGMKLSLPAKLKMGSRSQSGTANNLDDIALSFAFLTYFLGNDFLPIIPMFSKLATGMEFIFTNYSSVTQNGTLGEYSVIIDGQINFVGFRKLVDVLVLHEKSYLDQQVLVQTSLLSRYAGEDQKKLINTTLLNSVNAAGQLNLEKYKLAYYKKEFGNNEKNLDDRIMEMCKQYVRMLVWNYKYYTDSKVPSWSEYYPYHYAPFMSDLQEYFNRFPQQDVSFVSDHPIKPFLQLLCVLPPKNLNILPVSLRPIFSNIPAHLQKYFPTSFQIDYEGKIQEYQGASILPFPDLQIMNKEYEKFERKYDLDSDRKNMFEQTKLYEYDESFSTKYESSYCIIAINHTKVMGIDDMF